jgi:UDP-N-acetylglucosamine 4,6-dehydratase/5-epimerase
MFDRKKVLITGGTGSLGTALTRRLLKTNVDTIRIFSREEFKQIQMQNNLKDKRLRFLIGDVRDKERLIKATEDIDIVIHAAALKHVPLVEYNPFEAVKTNVYGSQNLIDACFQNNVKKVIAVGTDKAVSPLNTYGATKMLMERLFVSANLWRGKHDIKFICVRYGNVLGSRGSVVPLFIDQIKQGNKITVTNSSMTRFNITMNQALDLIFRACDQGVGGEVFIPKLNSYRLDILIDSIKELLKKNIEISLLGIRPGEKFHESLISSDELRNTYETNDDYILFDQDLESEENRDYSHLIPNKSLKESYSSNKVKLLSKEELKKILFDEKFI